MSDLTKEESNTIATVLANLAASIAMTIPPLNIAVAVKDIGEAGWDLWGEKNEARRIELTVDIILAVICLIPCVGGAFRYTFKTVLRDPGTYGPVLFYIVEGIISAIKSYYSSDPKLQMPETVKTLISHNPESLIDLIFNMTKIKSCLNEVRTELHKSVASSWLGNWTADKLDAFLAESIPVFLRIFEMAILTKILRMKTIARNRNSAVSNTSAKPNPSSGGTKPSGQGKPGAPQSTSSNKPTTPPKGRGAPVYSSTVAEMRNKLKTYSASMKGKLSGGIGEHITDYYCYEVLKWGSTWEGHDKEKQGYWRHEPSTTSPGKLNRYEDKNKGGILNKLQFVEAGTGIDGFWKLPTLAEKKYAIVESKSTMKVFGNNNVFARALGIVNGTDRANGKPCPVVQMSHKWIEDRLDKLKNINALVRADILALNRTGRLRSAYSRHLMLTQLADGSALQHLKACYDSVKGDMNVFADIPEEHHRGHKVARHIEGTNVETIINLRRFPPAKSKEGQSGQGNNRRK